MHNTLKTIELHIQNLLQKKPSVLIAIDGRCASGKTTLASRIKEIHDCNLIHMDHFFLRPNQRTAERINTPGGNVDHERFLQETLLPLRDGEAFSYRPYDCQTQTFTEPIQIFPKAVNIIEGSYSCHPTLCKYYDLRVFLTLEKAEQLRRIEHRNGKSEALIFEEKWIPLEEAYFSAFSIAENSDLKFNMSSAAKGE